MERAVVYNKVVSLVSPYCKDEMGLKNVTEDSTFLGDLRINSARLVDIVLAIEDEFGIEVDDESADNIRTVGDAVSVILENMGVTETC